MSALSDDSGMSAPHGRKAYVQDAQPCVACHEPTYLRLDGIPSHTARQCAPGPVGQPQGFGWCSVCGQRYVHVDRRGRLLCNTCDPLTVASESPSEVTYGRYKIHPVLDALPLIEGEQSDLLVADIDKQGLLEPIVLAPDGETIVDGRNRCLACKEAGRDPIFRTLGSHHDERALIGFVASANLYCTKLTVDQQAMIEGAIGARAASSP